MKIVSPTVENLETAAACIRRGELVGMPTETVYGIAANALDANAVAATFVAKGRPSDNPLIVHVASQEQALGVAKEFPPIASQLAEKFWPGPLTLVLPKSAEVPDIVTAGLGTVALRMPAHVVARQLIEMAGVPVSAPSANKFMSLSPTTAHMIDPQIAQHLALILDGGMCQVGIESTVLDLSEDAPRILRPGAITAEQIEAVIGRVLHNGKGSTRKSPGMYPKHYAPRSPVRLVPSLAPGQGGLTLRKPNGPNQVVMSSTAAEYARDLYRCLHELDQMRVGTIFIEQPPSDPEWAAVHDRLSKIVGE